MNDKPIRLSRRAAQEVEEAIRRYRSDATSAVATRSTDSFVDASRHIGRHPETGSLPYADNGRLAEMRSWPVRGFPYLVFYIDRESEIDILRVLHASRHIPASLREDIDE